MSKRPNPGKCTYCMKYYEEMTWDHVLPLSWYPDITPNSVEKWKVPSCLKCNRDLGSIEEELLLRLGLCLDPNSLASLGISHKVLRSVNPKFGKNKRDRRIRERKRQKILNEIIYFQNLPKDHIFPNFGPSDSQKENGFRAVFISDDLLESYSNKLVRGMSLIIDQKTLNEEYSIELYVIKEKGTEKIQQLFDENSSLYHRGYGFIVRRLVRMDNEAWIYEFEIWKKLKFYVMVHPGNVGD